MNNRNVVSQLGAFEYHLGMGKMVKMVRILNCSQYMVHSYVRKRIKIE